jgi:hypothetical protein
MKKVNLDQKNLKIGKKDQKVYKQIRHHQCP